MNDLYLMFMNMTRKGLRLMLTLLTMTVAFMIYGVLAAFESALTAGVELSADDRLVVVNEVNFTQTLPYAYFNRVRVIEGIETAAHFNWFGGYYQEPGKIIPMFATNPEELLELYPEFVLSDEERAAFLSNRQALLVGQETADRG